MHVLGVAHVVLFIAVTTQETGAVHGSDVVRVGKTFDEFASRVVDRVGSETPFQNLQTESIFHDGGVEGVTHTYSLFLSVLAGCSFIPVPGDEVVVHCVEAIDCCHDHDPHTEGSVGVDGVFLEVPVHFVGGYIMVGKVLLEP